MTNGTNLLTLKETFKTTPLKPSPAPAPALNTTSNWGPSIQMFKTMGDIFPLRHRTLPGPSHC